MLASAGDDERAGELQVGQRRAAALTDEVICLYIRAQAESLSEVAGEAWTEIPRTRTDRDGIDLAGANPRVAHRRDSRLSSQHRRMRREPALQRVRIDCEYFREGIECQAARGDPVVAQQDRLGNRMRAAVEARKPVRFLEGVPAFRLGIAPRRCGGADTRDEHSAPRSNGALRDALRQHVSRTHALVT